MRRGLAAAALVALGAAAAALAQPPTEPPQALAEPPATAPPVATPVITPNPATDRAVARCLSCHLDDAGRLDIVGLAALQSLPPEWPLLFEDAFDLDHDGVAGRVRHVSGAGADTSDEGRPLIALYGRRLAAARLRDFARIAGAAHAIDVSDPAVMAAILDAFAARSPDPAPPPPETLARFEARGCAACHVTETFTHQGRTYAPLSDFLLHDLGDGPVRTTPLWGCPQCLEAAGHGRAEATEAGAEGSQR